MPAAPQRWFVAQIGAREHYAVSRALDQRGWLGRLYTDMYCSTGAALLARGPAPLRALAARCHPALPRERVVSFTGRALLERVLRLGGQGRVHEYQSYVSEGRRFAGRVLRALRAERLDPAHDAFFAYDTGALEVVEWLGAQGVPTVVGQIDPGPVEERLVQAERQRWPGWEDDERPIPELYWERLRAEWAAATRVVVNSEWSRRALEAEGVPPEKLAVVPLAYEAPPGASLPGKPERRRGTLRVLWLGTVILRKGIPYVLEAARRLLDRDLEVVVAGPIGITAAAVASAPRNVRFVGRVDRSAASAYYRAADVFVLPTISDGFALTQLEALAHGVPVVASTNCAAVVTPGHDGAIVPAADAEALAEAIARLDDDRGLLRDMSVAAPHTAARFSIARLATTLGRVFEPVQGPG